MRHTSLMLFIGLATAGISVSPASATVRIISDPGGAVIDYLERFESARVSGEPIIFDGACLSACTLAIGLLPRRQVCATPKAVLGFHAAWRRNPERRPSHKPTRHPGHVRGLSGQCAQVDRPPRRPVRAAYPPQGPRACRYGAGLRRQTRHPHPPHDAHDQVVITFGAPSGGAEGGHCCRCDLLYRHIPAPVLLGRMPSHHRVR